VKEAQPIGDLVEQRVDHRTIIEFFLDHVDANDLAAGGIDTDMQLPPGSTAGRAALFKQPFASPAAFQAGTVHQQMQRAGSCSPERRRFQRLRPTAQGGMVRNSEVKPEQSGDGADQALSLPQCQAKDPTKRQRRGDRRCRVLRLAIWCRSQLRPPRCARLGGKPHDQATALPLPQ
jgi:hypothetical protein